MLTKEEMQEFKEIHRYVYHGADCFGSRDLIKDMILCKKATDKQAARVCAEHFADLQEVF